MAIDFFSLPPELRYMIYELAFEINHHAVSIGGRQKPKAWAEKPKSMHMLLVSRQFGLEAGSLLFNKFMFMYSPSFTDFSLLPALSMSASRYGPRFWYCCPSKIRLTRQDCSEVLREWGIDSSAPWQPSLDRQRIVKSMQLKDKGDRFTLRTYDFYNSDRAMITVTGCIAAMQWTSSKPYKLLNAWID